jgi:PTH1 family peptidyl-tRNA hydrolase
MVATRATRSTLLRWLRGRADHSEVADRWLIVGLGNPEVEYGATRHNVGADVVGLLATKLNASFKPHRVQAQVADTFDKPGGTPLSLILPFGYMNNSGGPVQQAMTFYKVPADRLVVVHDDLDLELGRLRLKMGGGTGGHNGLKDIQRRCGGPSFLRCRLGIGRPPGRQDPADFVLKKFSAKEREVIDGTVQRAADAILDVVSMGLEAAQNRHHAA